MVQAPVVPCCPGIPHPGQNCLRKTCTRRCPATLCLAECTKDFTLALHSLTQIKKTKKQNKKPKTKQKAPAKTQKKKIYHRTQNNCFSVCFSRSFTETSFSSSLEAACFMQYPIKCFSSCFFLSCCTASVRSLLQLPVPLMLIEAGCLPRSMTVHQSVSGKCGRFFCTQLFMSSISQTILQEPVP